MLIRNLYASLYRMSVENPLRFLKLAILAVALLVVAVCGLVSLVAALAG
jgi:hypothetical protein